MNIETSFVRELTIKITPEEREQKGVELARKMIEIDKIEEAKKKATKQYTDKIKALVEESEKLAAVVASGMETRDVLCSERVVEDLHKVETYRHDTGEVISDRPFTRAEFEESRQIKLRLDVREDGAETETVDRETGLYVRAPDEDDETDTPAAEGDEESSEDADQPTIDDPEAVLRAKPEKEKSQRVVRRPRKGLTVIDGGASEPEPEKADDDETEEEGDS